MNRAALVLGLVATVSLSQVGCAKLREKLSGKSKETPTETVTTTSGGGSITTGGSKLPEGWPSNIPAYPGAEITAAMATPQGKTTVMKTKDPSTKVHDFYKDKLSGMRLQSDVNVGGTVAMSFRNGPGIVNVTASASGTGDTLITISIADKS